MTDTAPWTECVVHSQHTDPDCEYCTQELEQKQNHLHTLFSTAQQTAQRVAPVIGGNFLESPGVLDVKLNTLVEMIFKDPKHRMAFEVNAMVGLIKRMEEIRAQAQQQQLLVPGAHMPQFR